MMATGDIARICYAADRAYGTALGGSEVIRGTAAGSRWSRAPVRHRQFVVDSVLALQAHPTLTPEQLHERWRAETVAHGWGYGPVKDTKAKQHPCCVPYAELSAEQRRRDLLFMAIVRACLEEIV